MILRSDLSNDITLFLNHLNNLGFPKKQRQGLFCVNAGALYIEHNPGHFHMDDCKSYYISRNKGVSVSFRSNNFLKKAVITLLCSEKIEGYVFIGKTGQYNLYEKTINSSSFEDVKSELEKLV